MHGELPDSHQFGHHRILRQGRKAVLQLSQGLVRAFEHGQRRVDLFQSVSDFQLLAGFQSQVQASHLVLDPFELLEDLPAGDHQLLAPFLKAQAVLEVVVAGGQFGIEAKPLFFDEIGSDLAAQEALCFLFEFLEGLDFGIFATTRQHLERVLERSLLEVLGVFGDFLVFIRYQIGELFVVHGCPI